MKVFQFKTTVATPANSIRTASAFSDFYEGGTMAQAIEVYAEDLHRYGLPLDKTSATIQEYDDTTDKAFGDVFAYNPLTGVVSVIQPETQLKPMSAEETATFNLLLWAFDAATLYKHDKVTDMKQIVALAIVNRLYQIARQLEQFIA